MGALQRVRKQAVEQVRDARAVVKSTIVPAYDVIFDVYDRPIPPKVLMLYVAHESGGRRWCATSYPEVGLAQLTARKNDDDEVSKYGVDPLDPIAHVVVSQWAFEAMRKGVRAAITKSKFKLAPEARPFEEMRLLLLARSVGPGCTKNLILRSVAAVPKDEREGSWLPITRWLNREDVDDDLAKFSGAQPPDVVRLRYTWCSLISSAIRPFRPDPLDVERLNSPPRPIPVDAPKLPVDFHARIAYYCNRARQEGPWPPGRYMPNR